MARLPRLTAPGLPHHVIQRGNNRQPVFADSADCERYLGILPEQAHEHALAVHAYVLMPNHVHLLATPPSADTLALVMQGLGRTYVRWFNHRHRRTGTLWEGRYRSAVIEADRYFLACMRYIELNPVRAAIVDAADKYRWSSHAHHTGRRLDRLITEHPLYWALGNTPFERQSAYRRLFETPLATQEIEAIRTATQSGWALGGRAFADALTQAGGRRALPGKAGRPRTREHQPVPD